MFFKRGAILNWIRGSKVSWNLQIIKNINNIHLLNRDSEAIPGATINYNIVYSNVGSGDAQNVIIYDIINSNTAYKTQNNTTFWTCEWSTNTNPDQSWGSIQYTKTLPPKDKIRWVRWKTASVSASSTGVLNYTVIIK